MKILDISPENMLEPTQKLLDLVQETLGENLSFFCYTN